MFKKLVNVTTLYICEVQILGFKVLSFYLSGLLALKCFKKWKTKNILGGVPSCAEQAPWNVLIEKKELRK